MKSHRPQNTSKSSSKFRVRMIRSEDVAKGVQRAAWPSLDSPAEMTRPVILPTEPQVELLNQPDNQTKIVVTCTCGKRIEIACEV